MVTGSQYQLIVSNEGGEIIDKTGLFLIPFMRFLWNLYLYFIVQYEITDNLLSLNQFQK